MASADFEAWLADSYAERVVLCDIQLAEQTAGDGWTATGANSYRLSLNPYIAESVVTGGVYRRIDGVRENADDYTERGSSALVDANPSSWYYDEANTYLYVRTSTSADPDTFTSILVFFSLFVGTTVKAFEDGNIYEPMLTGELPVIVVEAETILFGVKIMEAGNLDLQNANGFWDTVSQDYIWKNKKVTFYLGGDSLLFSDYEMLSVMRIDNAAIGDDMCRFRLTHMGTVLNKTLLFNTITKSDYAFLADGVEGSFKPILWGKKEHIPCKCVDRTFGANQWLVSDPDAHELTDITNVRAMDSVGAQHGLTENVHYTKSLVTNIITVTDLDFDVQNFSVVCEATGKTDGASGYLNTWAAIARDILELKGEATTDIDTAAFTTADSDNPNEIGLYVNEPKTVAEYLTMIQASARGYIYIDREGLWTAQTWFPVGIKGETTETRSDADFVSWQPEDKLETNYHKVIVRHNQNHITGEWRERSAEDTLTQYELEYSDEVIIETLLLNSSQAEAHAQRLLLTMKRPTIQIEVEERGLDSMLNNPGERLLITRTRAPDSTGAWAEEPCEILEIQKTLSPPGIMLRIRAIGLDDRGDKVRAWAGSGINDYDAESSANKDAYAFWHDSNGEVGAANVERHSVWY